MFYMQSLILRKRKYYKGAIKCQYYFTTNKHNFFLNGDAAVKSKETKKGITGQADHEKAVIKKMIMK